MMNKSKARETSLRAETDCKLHRIGQLTYRDVDFKIPFEFLLVVAQSYERRNIETV